MASKESAVNQRPANGPSAAYRGGGEAFSHSNSLALLVEAATAAIQAELDVAEREAEAILEHGLPQAEGIRQRVDAQAREINERAERQVREILARADRDAQDLLQRARAEAEAAEQAARVRAQEIRVQAEARLWARLESIRPGVAQERGYRRRRFRLTSTADHRRGGHTRNVQRYELRPVREWHIRAGGVRECAPCRYPR
jgi:hypothetical protein